LHDSCDQVEPIFLLVGSLKWRTKGTFGMQLGKFALRQSLYHCDEMNYAE
jgi:hypothetical protein